MKARSAYRRAQMRAYSVTRSRRMGVMPRAERRITNRAILATIKQEIGECQLHTMYNNGERKFVMQGYEYLFDMDHIDPAMKHKTIAQMMASPELEFRAEIAKCQLVCIECHRRKTIENKEWLNRKQERFPVLTIRHNQLTLFDN